MHVQEGRQSRDIALAGLAQHPADCLVHQVLVVIDELLGNSICVVQLPAPDEGTRGKDRRPALHRPARPGQVVEDGTRLVDQVFANDVDHATVNQVPGIDQVMTAQVQLVELATPLGRGLTRACLEIHDAHRADPRFMLGALEQRLDLIELHVHVLAGQREDLPHADSRAQSGKVAPKLICRRRHNGILAGETSGVAKRDDPEAVLAALGEVFDAISSSGFDLDQVLQTINRHAVELAGADFGNILRFDDERGHYRIIAYAGDIRQAYVDLVSEFPYREDRGSMIGRTLLEKRPVQIADVFEDPEYTAWEIQKAGGYRTILGVPMLRDDVVVGLFVLWRFEVDPFSEREISLLSTFASQALLAIENLRLFQTVERQRTELARFAPQAAALLGEEGGESMLAGHRRQITAMFCDLRGFTSFAESAEPEEVLGVLREYHAAVGEVVISRGGTVEHFAGDGLMAFFNDPTVVPEHEKVAVNAALEIRKRFETLANGWSKRGYELGLGIGLSVGYATLGRIGFEGRFDYGAVGNVVILASRLSDSAKPGEVLISQRLNAAVESDYATQAAEDQALKGFSRPVPAFRVLGPRE